MALNVGVEDLNCMLGKKAFMEMFVILDQSEPGLQQLVICFHVHHVIFIKLRERKIHKAMDIEDGRDNKSHIATHTFYKFFH